MKMKTVIRSAFKAESEKWDAGRTNEKRENMCVCLCVHARVLYLYIYFSKYCTQIRVTPGKSKTSKQLNVSHFVENESSLQHSQEHGVIHYLGLLNSFHQVPIRSFHYPFQFYIPIQENILKKILQQSRALDAQILQTVISDYFYVQLFQLTHYTH